MANTFHCKVITPEETVLDCDIVSAAFTAHDGERGVLVNHAPLTGKLGIGVLRVETKDDRKVMFIDGGFGQVVDNDLTILTEQAKVAADIDAAAAKQALADAHALKVTDEASFIARQNAIARARAQIKLARSS